MKHSLTPMTDAEENAWMLIVNDEAWNNDIADTSTLNEREAGELVRTMLMNGLRRQMNVEYSETQVRNSLIYLHVLHNQDNIDHAHSSLIDKYVDCGLESDCVLLKKYTKLMPTDKISGTRPDKVIVDEVEIQPALTATEVEAMEASNAIMPSKQSPIIDYHNLGKSLLYCYNYGGTAEDLLEKLRNVTREYFPPVTNKLQPENNMQAELKVTKVNGKTTSTTINDVEVSGMQNEQIIAHIIKAEKKVDELKTIKVDSKAVKKEVTRLNKFVKDVAALLDAKK